MYFSLVICNELLFQEAKWFFLQQWRSDLLSREPSSLIGAYLVTQQMFKIWKTWFSFINWIHSYEEMFFSTSHSEDMLAITIDSKKVAVDVFKVRKEGSNDMEGILNFFTKLPKFILSFIVKIVMFLDNHGINPKALTEGDTNYATILFSNLGSIKTNSVYHHLNEYGTNSIVITIGTIREEKDKKIVDITATLDERIADGFYFAKSIQLAEYIAKNPELLLEDFEIKIDND